MKIRYAAVDAANNVAGDVIYTSAATPDVASESSSLIACQVLMLASLRLMRERTGEVRFAADTTPDHETTASYAITVTATVGSQSATQDATISVTDVNDAPTLANAIADQVATEGQGFSYTIQANTFGDEDAGDTLTITVAETADWLSYDDATGVLRTPPVGAADVTVTVTATDSGGLTAIDDEFTITVEPFAVTIDFGQSATTGDLNENVDGPLQL